MDAIFIHSRAIDQDQVRETGSFTTLPVRIHKNNDISHEAALKIMRDWNFHINYHSQNRIPVSIAEHVNMNACIYPEALPERLAVVTYLTDMGTIYDDYCEVLPSAEAAVEYGRLKRTLDVTRHNLKTDGTKDSAIMNLMAQCILDIIRVDREFGMYMLDTYNKGWVSVAGRECELGGYESYIDQRINDIGFKAFWPIVEFSMDLRLSDHEKEITSCLFRTVNECLILTQDYWSWEREYYSWKKHGTRLFNAVKVFTHIDNLTAEEAKEIIKAKIIDLERKYVTQKEEFYLEFPRESIRLRRWVETAGLIIAAHHYWASKCPRHHDFLHGMNGDSSNQKGGTIGKKDEISPSSPDKSVWTGVKRPLNQNSDDPQENESANKRVRPDEAWRKPDPMALMAPCKYVTSLPSKGIRSLLIHALNVWLEAPASSIEIIEEIIRYLHDASLILDDIEDNSLLRRGKPATHTIFGSSQSINSANFMFVKAVSEARKLQNSEVMEHVLDGLENLYLGQSWDLFWKHNLTCPSEKEYLNMADNKTGGMFKMLTCLLRAECTENASIYLDSLISLFGRFFQIRDDYMNLASTEYSVEKGFCEDLDEGKYSYLIVRLLEAKPELKGHVNGIFRQRPIASQLITELPPESKLHILDLMKEGNIFTATLNYLKELETEIENEITRIEGVTGKLNPLLHLIVVRLSVMHL